MAPSALRWAKGAAWLLTLCAALAFEELCEIFGASKAAMERRVGDLLGAC